MAKPKNFRENFYTNIAPIITGVGASIVIVGALFKIQHYPGAGPILTIGMIVEAVIFFMFAFAPVPHDPEWARAYPVLDDHVWDQMQKSGAAKSAVGGEKSVVKSIDDMMSQAKIDQGMVDRLGMGFKSLSESVTKIGQAADASIATKEYATNVKQAAGALNDMNKSYAQTVQAMSEMSSAAGDAKAFHGQVQTITKNLGALNAVYEMELQDANNHMKAMNQFIGSLTQAMGNMSEASKDTEAMKQNIGKLNGNLSSLNNVYGNMLAAMRS